MHVRQLPADPTAVREARRFVAAELDAVGFRGDAEAVALLVSELATNAVRHAGGPFDVGVEAAPDHVRVEVHDDDRTMPTLLEPTPGEAGGRGIAIIDLVADRWGCAPVEGDGKLVWFSLGASPLTPGPGILA